VLGVAWRPPTSPNGPADSLVYKLAPSGDGSGRVLLTGSRLTSFAWQHLEPYTRYAAVVTACVADTCGVSGGLRCTASGPGSGLTAEAPPQGMLAPAVAVLGPHAAAVRWQPPARANSAAAGLAYRLLRNGAVVYRGPLLEYSDDGLAPGEAYAYRVAASNAAGEAMGPEAPAVVTFLAAPQVPPPPTHTHARALFPSTKWRHPPPGVG